MALVRQQRNLKACSCTINDEWTDIVTYFDMARSRKKFDWHFNADLQLHCHLCKVLVYSIAFLCEYRVHNLTSTSISKYLRFRARVRVLKKWYSSSTRVRVPRMSTPVLLVAIPGATLVRLFCVCAYTEKVSYFKYALFCVNRAVVVFLIVEFLHYILLYRQCVITMNST